MLNSSTLITIVKYWQILLKFSQFQTSAFLPLLRTHKQTGMAHFATALLIIRHWHFWDSNLQTLCCPMLPVCPKSIVLFEGSHALPACPVKWSTEMKHCEAMMKWYWQVLGASPAANRLICRVTLEEKNCSTPYVKNFSLYLTENTSTFTLKAVLYEGESHENLKLLLQAGPPSLHYCCAVVLHSYFILPPVGHSSNHEYHCCQLTDNRRVFRIFIALLRFSFDSSSYNLKEGALDRTL